MRRHKPSFSVKSGEVKIEKSMVGNNRDTNIRWVTLYVEMLFSIPMKLNFGMTTTVT